MIRIGGNYIKPIADLNHIIDKQKTVSTKRIAPLVRSVGQIYADTSKKVTKQKERIKELERLYNIEKTKSARLSAHVQNHEDLKRAHEELKKKYKALQKR